ncbi:MAG: sugar phosphate isomerase/epimerase family protein [Pirellulales bacterium]
MPVVKLSRRDLLSAATAVAAASSLPGAARAADHDLNLGIQLYSLRGYPVDEALRHAREIGFRYVEFYPGMYPLSSSSEQIAAMNKKLADLGLTISAHGVNGFGADAAANRKVFEFAKAAGIRTLGADPAPEAFASLDELVKEFDIRIAIHNHGPKHRYNKVLDVLRAIEKHDERIGACADLGHFIRSGENPVEVIRLLKGRLYGIHLKDFQDQQENTKGVILGKGHLDVPAVFAALEQVNFPADGALSLEYEENPKDPLADIRECFEVATSALAAA